MTRLADISIDADGEDFVFRVRLGDRVRSWLAHQFAGAIAPQKARVVDVDSANDAGHASRPRRKSGVAPDPAIAERNAKIADAYAADDPIEEIAARFGVNPNSVKVIASKLGKRRPARDQVAAEAVTESVRKVVNPAPAPSAAERDAEIARRYVEDEMPVSVLEDEFGIGATAIRAALKRQGVALRTARESMVLAWATRRANEQARRGRDALAPKPAPIAVPADAKRRAYDAPPPGPGQSGDAYRKSLQRHFAKQRLGLSPAEQQRLVEEYFDKNGAIT